MHARKRQSILPGLMLAAGVLGMLLRVLLNQFCRDARLLLPAMHPMGIALGLLTVAALGLAAYTSRNMKPEAEDKKEDLPGSRNAFLGHILAAAGVLLTVLVTPSGMQGRLAAIWKTLAFASVPCLAAAGWLRSQGRQPFYLLHLCPMAFLVVHTIGQYQRWSSDPQLLNYIFPLLGIICIVFFVFYHCAFDAGLHWRRRLRFCGLASICLGILALPGCGYPWLYLGMALWALLDLPEEVKAQ